MKKILLVSTIPLSLKVFSLGFMEFLRDKGFEVEAAGSPGEGSEYIRAQGFRYHEIPISRRINPGSDFKSLCLLEEVFEKGKFDIIHTQTSKAGFIGRLAGYRKKVPLVIHTAHNWACHDLLPAWQKNFYLMLEKKAAKWCDAIIVDTKAVRDYGLKLKIAASDKIHQIYMGIELDRFREYKPEDKMAQRQKYGINPNKIIVGTIARLVPDKGIETFLACAQQLRDNKNLVFMVGGDGELRNDFEKEVQKAGMKDRFIFTGHLDDVVPYLNMFDIFCLPTLREGFGVVFAEAQACGVPVVASDIGPLREVVIDGVSGRLVPVNNVKEFSNTLGSLLDPNLRNKYAQAARKHVQNNFDINKINEQILALYKQLWEQKIKVAIK